MRTSIVYNFEIDKLDTSCDCVMFAGELFANGVSIDAILNFQRYIDSLPCIVVVFYDCCLFQVRNDRIFARESYMEVYFDRSNSKLYYNGSRLETGVHDIVFDHNNYVINIENNQIHKLPRLTGTIKYIELRYCNCSQQTINYVRNLYGRIDKCINLNAKQLKPQFVNLISIEWSNVLCFRRGYINFNDMETVTLIRGGNGVGKTSLLSIILYGFFGTSSKRMLRIGCTAGNIKAIVEILNSRYEVEIDLGNNFENIRVTKDGEIVATDHSFMPQFHAAIREKFEYKLNNIDQTNNIFGELCGINISPKSVAGDEETPINSLSAGQKFMLELSYKLSQETAPQIFFIDERMDKLDDNCVRRCIDMILKYRKKTLIVTHRDVIASHGSVIFINKYRGASEIDIKNEFLADKK